MFCYKDWGGGVEKVVLDWEESEVRVMVLVVIWEECE